MKGILMSPRKSHLIIVTAFVIVAALTIASISQAQISTKKTIGLYKITGKVQILDLDGKWVEIDGRRWELADNFDKKDLPREWQKRKKLEFNDSQKVWIYFYVRLLRIASPEEAKMSKEKIHLVTEPNEIERIHENRGKIYRIELIPA